MKHLMIVITKDYAEGKYEIPDVYPVKGDINSDCDKERASAILGMLYQKYLETEEQESAIPIDHKRTFCEKADGYAQITWENGDVHRYFLTDSQDVPGFEDSCTGYEDANTNKMEVAPWCGQVLPLSTVHILPEAVDFLAQPMNSDKLQIFPNNDSCVMHITDAEEVLEHDLPLCVKDCIRYAWKKGYPWIYFGYEGKEQAGLPTYRSAWDRI